MKYDEKLNEAGINTEAALKRFSGNEALYLRFLNKFPQDQCFTNIGSALEQRDYQAAFQAAHTLKGVSGNLGMDALFEAASKLVEALRARENEKTDALYGALAHAHKRACEVILELQRENQ